MTTFTALGLAPELLRALAERGYTSPTPIQARAIPEILHGRDVLASAQTGTGKTAGFVLPLLQRLSVNNTQTQRPRALFVVPTRELAAQVHESVRSYGQYLRLRSLVVFGGVSIKPQIDALRRGTDILIATPGRLLDHVQQRTCDLSSVEFLVLDEADRMLDMGFIHDIRRILKLLPAQRQNLMFSATYSEEIRRLTSTVLRNPVQIDVAVRNATVSAITQHAYLVAKDQKRDVLVHLIRNGDWPQVLIFTRTKHGANRLAQQLDREGIQTAAIHGNKSQAARTRALADFKEGRLRALVATEVAARGLDIKELPYVVNYELPNVPEDYVHRIGRTARAGTSGTAVSLIATDELRLLQSIERMLGSPIERVQAPRAVNPLHKDAPPEPEPQQRPPHTHHEDGGGSRNRGRKQQQAHSYSRSTAGSSRRPRNTGTQRYSRSTSR